MSESELPIGIFDSGVGGLTVFRAIERRLPNESLIYLGDTARIPYGIRSPSTVHRYAFEDAAFIKAKRVKAIAIACNTASALASEDLAREYSIPVLGVIEPGSRRAVRLTSVGRIGVIGTEATIASHAYEKAMFSIRSGLDIISRACPLLVPLAEEGWLNHPVTQQVVEEYLQDLKEAAVDTLVLGCTHYPILRPVIDQVMGNSVRFVDSGEAVADELAEMLESNQLLKRGAGRRSEQFYVTDSASRFKRVAELFLGRPIDHLETVELGAL
ncbi:MAG: glutamate racemase [Blastocatellia bacterium AA13]|nr:MAG: glutamate racemase [Blastocatellia bacterium AA13]